MDPLQVDMKNSDCFGQRDLQKDEIATAESAGSKASEYLALEGLALALAGQRVCADKCGKQAKPYEIDEPLSGLIAAKEDASKIYFAGKNKLFDFPKAAFADKDIDGTCFLKDLPAFEKRMQERAANSSERTIPPIPKELRLQEASQQICGVYQCLDRLLCDGSMEKRQKMTLARQILAQAADPSSVDQGAHPTCTVAALEVRAYARYPAQASKLVVELATAGEYISQRNGLRVKLDKSQLLPDDKNYFGPSEDGQRSHASKIFQLAAANLIHAYKKDSLAYIQVGSDKKDEGLYKLEDGKQKQVSDAPGLSDSDLETIGSEISGRNECGSTITHRRAFSYGQVSSLNDLKASLKKASESDNFPMLISVNAAKEPFKTDLDAGVNDPSKEDGDDRKKNKNSKDEKSDSWHQASIYGYDARSGKCYIDNQWGKDDDHIRKPISIEELYESMTPLKGPLLPFSLPFLNI